MSKRDSKIRYAIQIDVKGANSVREACGHESLSYEDMKTLAHRVAEAVNRGLEGYYDHA